MSNPNEVRLTIPLEITVRLGSAGAPTAAVPAAPLKALGRAAEKVRIDRDYENRAGFDATFIPGAPLALPTMTGTLQNQVAPLHPDQPNAAAGELKYQNFSIKMHKGKRMAIFSATNIDGETYLHVSRETGLVSDSEGETWYKDPRISASYYLEQPFYSAWSHLFDRGHITRRTDPTWGTAEEAERANGDTFHFTNCSPQHFRFNQTAKYWQGAERFILENGLIAADTGKRICVYQGPIFNSAIDLWSDDVQIPSSFFKIVVWKAATGLKSVGLIVDQSPLLGEFRVNLGPPRDVPNVNVQQWRVKISTIEQRTKLDFGAAIRNADTILTSAQPLVGAEAARPLRSLEDLLA